MDRPAWIPLPARGLEPAEWRTATVGSDCNASVRGVLYSVPYQLVGTRLDVRVSATINAPPGTIRRGAFMPAHRHGP